LLDIIPGDLVLIINNFVKERPRKNRGINIDIFATKEPFRSIIHESGVDKNNSKFWVEKTIHAKDQNQTNEAASIHFLKYHEKFFNEAEQYKSNSSFIVECGSRGFCFVSCYKRNHHNKISTNLASKLYPMATRAFLTSNEMYKLIQHANCQYNYDLRIRQEHTREISLDSESAMGYHGRPTSELPSVDEVFKNRRNTRRYLTMCKLIAANKNNPIEITFSGDGHIGLYEGSFEEIFHGFITPIIEVSSERVRRFSNRSMSETEDKKPKPISILFDSQPFEDVKDIQVLVGHIKNYTHCNYSIVHAGNPHLYMYIMDSADYSTFSVRTLGPDKIIVSPQIKTSAESMVRFTNHLLSLSKLGNGTIEN
jgi:hypothetical protein